MRCQGTFINDQFREEACTREATTRRKGWRFGDASRGEPTIVTVWTHYCQSCAETHDECVRENEAEARAS